MECPICGGAARSVPAPALSGRRFNCPRCGNYEVSQVVLDGGMLQRLNATQRLAILNKAREAAANKSRPIITTYLL